MTGWTKQAVEVLIEAYKDEPCLYAINNPNYHNKHLRNEALKRISAVVLTIRPNSSEKKCSVKLHNLRNQFNTENAKVRRSIKSGIGTENVYRPNLWYYESLKFLEEYVISRKSKSSLSNAKVAVDTRTFSTQEELETNEMTAEIEYIGVNEGEEIEINDSEMWTLEEQFTIDTVPSVTTQGLHATKGNQQSISNISATLPRVNTPSSSSSLTASPVMSTSSSVFNEGASTSSSRIPKKRKTQSEDAYIDAIQSIAQTLKTPTIPTNNVVDSENSVDNCMKFLCSLIQELKCPKLKLEVMNTLVQTVINVSTMDLEKSPQNKYIVFPNMYCYIMRRPQWQ